MNTRYTIPIFPCLTKPSAENEVMEFISKRKLELIYVVCMIGFVIGVTTYLWIGSLDSIRYAAIYIIPWAYPIIALCLFYFKTYIMSQRLARIESDDRNDPRFTLIVGSNAFSASVFLCGDLISLTAAMIGFYPIGFGPETDGFHRLHVIEPEISCAIMPFLAILSSRLLDTSRS